MGSLWNRSGMVERYADDLRAAGAQAFFFLGGTTSPLTVYQNSGESSAHPQPVVADANGRWPDVFVPYTLSYDVQVKSGDGVQLTYSVMIPNPNPVDQTIVIDPSQTISTGMIHPEFTNTAKVGYVRLNGNTIGNASSGASERAHVDTLNLFTYLWGQDPTLVPIFSGVTLSARGASASADFSTANKHIQLPDMRGASFSGLDDMGNTVGAAGAYAALTFSAGSATVACSTTGNNGIILATANMPPHSHGGTTSSDGSHTHTVTGSVSGNTGATSHSHTFSGTTSLVPAGLSHTHVLPLGTGQLNVGGGPPSAANAQVPPNAVSSATDVNHIHPFSGITDAEIAHVHSFSASLVGGVAAAGGTPSTGGNHNHTFTTDSQGGVAGIAQGFNNLGKKRLVTWFIKL